MAAESNYYTILGVKRDAAHEEIRKAFRERVRACHPDRVANLDEDLRRLAEEKMVELNEAYAVLRNPARRAAYDSRHSGKAAGEAAAGTARRGNESNRRTATSSPPGATGSPLERPAEARNRIGEQQFVARAASEEFQHTVRRCVTGQVSWTPLAFPGATVALHGRRGRSNLYFVLLAASQLDDRQVERFLGALQGFGGKLTSRLFGNDRLFGFAGAVEFVDRRRQQRALERFNRGRGAKDAVQPATLIDLVNWYVLPGETSLQSRLECLLRGG